MNRTNARIGRNITGRDDLPSLLKEARKFRGVSQRELRDVVGIDDTTLSDYEVNRHQPKLTTMATIADGLDMDLWVEFVPRERR